MERVPRTGGPRRAEQRFNESGRPGEQLRPDIGGDGHEQRLEQLTDDPVRELALQLATAGCEHPHPRRADDRTPLGKQAGLADAGTALDDDEPPTTTPRRVGDCLQRCELGFALQ